MRCEEGRSGMGHTGDFGIYPLCVDEEACGRVTFRVRREVRCTHRPCQRLHNLFFFPWYLDGIDRNQMH